MNKPNSVDRASDHSVVMPWAKRAEELEQSEGPYCDYAAFCEWLEAWNERQEPSIQFDTDAVDKTSLYIAFFAACSEIANAANRKISRLEYMVDLNAAKITAQANAPHHGARSKDHDQNERR